MLTSASDADPAQGAARHGQLGAAERRLLRRARVVHQPADAGAVRGVRPRLAARARAHAHRVCAGRAGDGRLRGRRLAAAGRVPGALVRAPARVPPATLCSCVRTRCMRVHIMSATFVAAHLSFCIVLHHKGPARVCRGSLGPWSGLRCATRRTFQGPGSSARARGGAQVPVLPELHQGGRRDGDVPAPSPS